MPRAIPVGALVVYHDNGPPSTSDDSATIRARRGYWWVDALAGDFWLCVDPAEGAAVWYRLGNAEDLAAIALSGSWDDLGDTPTTLAGYGITDAATDADLTAHKQATDNPHQVTAAQVGAPPDSRTISTGTGLEGGGDLSEDRTLSLSAGTLDSLGRADSAVQPGDLAAIATSGDWADISGTPTTLSGYGITDAALASDLTSHENDTSNPHGVTYAQVGAPPDTRQVTAGTGLTGGGDLTADRSFALTTAVQASLGLADTAVQPGDLSAIATSGSWADLSGTPTTLAGYGITDAATSAQGSLADTALQPGDVGTAAYQDVAAFDAAGSAAAVADDLTSHENDTSNPHGVTASQVGAPPISRSISAGTGLTGGGNLSANRTISLSQSTQNSLALADTAVQPGDLAAIATSGAWGDLTNTPTTLSGYGITDALGRASNLADLSSPATARSNLGLGSAAVENTSAFDAAGSAAAVAGDLLSHEQDTNNPHAVTYSQVGADPSGSAAAAESNANSYTDNAINALGSAAYEYVGTQPLELPRNTELGSGAFAPYEPASLYPVVTAAAHILTPDDAGKAVWSGAHDITLPDSAAPGMQPGWRCWIKNTDGVSSLTIDCDGSGDTLDGGASLSLAAGESVLIVMIADGEFGSL